MGKLGARRYEGFEEAHRYDLPAPSLIHLPDGPPERRGRAERRVADVAPPARVRRPMSLDFRQALEGGRS